MDCEICKRFRGWSEPCFDENNMERFDNYPDCEKEICKYYTDSETVVQNEIPNQDVIETDVMEEVDINELIKDLSAQRYDLNDESLFKFEPI